MIKICGITNEEDAAVAVEAGADALGFNFYAGSPRCITPRRAREIARAVPGNYLRAGIAVNASESELARLAEEAQVDVLQLHGRVPAMPLSNGARLWRAIPANEAPREPAADFEAYLFDSAGVQTGVQYGGTGQTFDWTIAAGFPARVILAGGLDAGNVADAIRVAEPWGVDACSRLEISPGKKDSRRVREFVHAAALALGRNVTV